MTSLFISYSRKDEKFVERLSKDLRAEGYDVWVDFMGIRGGQEWVNEIEKAVRSCDAFIVVISPDSMKSEWVDRETVLAMHLDKPTVPVMLREAELPLQLVTTHYVDFTGSYKNSFGSLLSSLPGPSRTPRKAPERSTATTGGLSKLIEQIRTWATRPLVLGTILVGISIAVALGLILTNDSTDSGRDETPVPDIEEEATPRPESRLLGASGRLAFTSVRDEGLFSIYLMDISGANLVRLTDASTTDVRPVWSADGERMLFVSWRNGSPGNPDLYVMDGDGSNLSQLTNDSAEEENYSWSPSGSQIVYQVPSDSGSDIVTMDIESATALTLTKGLSPRWSADGNQIIFSAQSGGSEIFIIEADGTSITQLTDNSLIDEAPAVSPDGTRVVFRQDIGTYLMNLDGTESSQINALPGSRYLWSPSGNHIAFVADTNNSLYIMASTGLNTVRLTEQGRISGFSWSPDGNHLVFGSNSGGNFDLYLTNTAGSEIIQLTDDPGDDFSPEWQP